MGNYVGELVIRALNAAGTLPRDANVWILGLTFKENVPDFRNTRATDVAAYLQGFDCNVTTWEPMVDAATIEKKFNLPTETFATVKDIDAVVLINGHDAFRAIDLAELKARMRTPVLVDIKNFFPRDKAEELGFVYKSL
jgi:UDP-N-acetyl-D-galactosamine dehydrogenase